jgi:hypothetical protein
MIRILQQSNQLRIDTTINIIEADGTEIISPVLVVIGLAKVDEKQQFNIYKIANNIFNKKFTLDRRPKTITKKPWWEFWKSK